MNLSETPIISTAADEVAWRARRPLLVVILALIIISALLFAAGIALGVKIAGGACHIEHQQLLAQSNLE